MHIAGDVVLDAPGVALTDLSVRDHPDRPARALAESLLVPR
ncbi:hypothetical protein [Actinomadura alba]